MVGEGARRHGAGHMASWCKAALVDKGARYGGREHDIMASRLQITHLSAIPLKKFNTQTVFRGPLFFLELGMELL